ncbi:hypothetical protein AL035_11035 [Salipiger aestuarii]|nr:hypothetical protein AL037_13610 [Salipiger aestuarii]KAB2541705.1 hypothetical protein AL035_11035 [Salipiger aestuarii]
MTGPGDSQRPKRGLDLGMSQACRTRRSYFVALRDICAWNPVTRAFEPIRAALQLERARRAPVWVGPSLAVSFGRVGANTCNRGFLPCGRDGKPMRADIPPPNGISPTTSGGSK